MNTTSSQKWYQRLKLPRAVIIAVCVLPAVLTIAFYSLRPVVSVMAWAAEYISAPVRGFLGLLSSVYPLSMMEVLCTAAAIWLIYYLVRTVMVTVRRRGKIKILAKRLLPVFVAALYVWSLFCWLWNSGYHAPGFAVKNGFTGGGVTVGQLTAVTRSFAEKANEFSQLVNRDVEGRYVADRRVMFDESTEIYGNLASEFPSLSGRIYRPKAMIYSWLMSRTGYSGMYFALTGEANINTMPPGPFMPATVAHEHAHQLGIFAEDEANFVGIAACLSSGNAVFEYAGYLSGLSYLLSALASDDIDAWYDICDSLCDEVLADWNLNSEFWASQRTVNTGVAFIDNILTTVTVTVSDAVDTIYDGYLRSQNQQLGIKSYGACVDLLVAYFYVEDVT